MKTKRSVKGDYEAFLEGCTDDQIADMLKHMLSKSTVGYRLFKATNDDPLMRLASELHAEGIDSRQVPQMVHEWEIEWGVYIPDYAKTTLVNNLSDIEKGFKCRPIIWAPKHKLKAMKKERRAI